MGNQVKEVILLATEDIRELSDKHTLFFNGIKINVWGEGQSITLLEKEIVDLKDKLHRRNMQIKDLKERIDKIIRFTMSKVGLGLKVDDSMKLEKDLRNG